MSTTSSAAANSRSSSPRTPEPPDCPGPVSIQSDLDQTFSDWHLPMYPTKTTVPRWAADQAIYTPPHKVEEEQMLRLDELIEKHAYEDSPPSEIRSAVFSSLIPYHTAASSPPTQMEHDSGSVVPHHSVPSISKAIPPPATVPRKPELTSSNQRVVYPPKEACFNLPILFPSIPEGGTKSRVETQVRVTVDLAQSCPSSESGKYEKVGSWKWLKLPHGTATKRRTRKQGKIDPDPQEILRLAAVVTCSTPPHNPVLSCSSCQTREAKRVAKKLAARVRPARSESESDGTGAGKARSKTHEDTTSIIQFNCAETLEFSAGSVVLPLRITCYCRHHREKVGFHVHFTMVDHLGRIVGTGMTKPIMITDDHKTTSANKPPELTHNLALSELAEWSRVGNPAETKICSDTRTTLRRKSEVEVNGKATKKRHKPYDPSAKPNRVLREGSISSAPSPSVAHSPVLPTRASTPPSLLAPSDSPTGSHPPPLHYPMHGSESSSPDSIATPLDHNPDVLMRPIAFDIRDSQPDQATVTQPNALFHPPINVLPSDLSLANLALSLPFLSMDPNQASQSLHVHIPIIHRLIPNSGPTFGGIEVTLLGANFHPTIPLACVFGDVTATSTHRWSDNTLVCVLPARATAGVVPVWFEGFRKAEDAPLFAYTDDSDRALMELALQVVGLKMTGKIEDAKNVAMRIVGNTGNDNPESSNGTSNIEVMQMSPSTRDLRPLLLTPADQLDPFETRIIDLLSVLDTPMESHAPDSLCTSSAISHSTPSGQTLLHLAAFLDFGSLTRFLIEHGADLDARDRIGFTPLHFAVLAQSRECMSALMQSGADLEIVDSRGKTAEEIGPEFFHSVITEGQQDGDSESDYWDDEDADLGDAEDDADPELRHIMQRRISRRATRSHNSSGKVTPLWSSNLSRAATPPPLSPLLTFDEKMKIPDVDKKPDLAVNDEKRAASFIEKMQRTLAQIPAPPGINIPQLPLPDLSSVPWGTLPQIPLVFPVYVPIHWPSFRGAHQKPKSTDPKTDCDADEATKNMAAVALRTAQEWRATWEKWFALVVAATARQQTEDVPPPVYTPRVDEQAQTVQSTSVELQEQTLASTSRRSHPDTRPVGYDTTPVPDQIVESFTYQPQVKQGRRTRKKRDLMLLLFWLPILLLSIVWAFHHGVRVVFQVVKTVFPPKANVRT